ncbi:MAG: DNA-directed RNA polymerase subunit omega [Candidatus Karelsulcia muelleri]
MNIKEYKNCKDSTKTVDFPGNNVYYLISILSKRSEQIFCYIKSKLNLCKHLEYFKHLEEVVIYEAQMKLSKSFEKISKPTSLAIREFLDKKLYYIFKKQLKKKLNK